MANPGLSPEVQAAISRRGAGASPAGVQQPQLNQMSPGAAGAPQMPPPTPQSQLPQVQQPQPVQNQKFTPRTQQDLIVQSLVEQMKINNKANEQQTQISSQPQAVSQGPAGGGMGGCGMDHSKGGGGFSLSPGYEQPMAVNQMQSNYGYGMGKDYSGLNGYGSNRM